MNSEVQAAIIKVAGDWAITIAKTYNPKDQIKFSQDLQSIFHDAYLAIASEVDKLS